MTGGCVFTARIFCICIFSINAHDSNNHLRNQTCVCKVVVMTLVKLVININVKLADDHLFHQLRMSRTIAAFV